MSVKVKFSKKVSVELDVKYIKCVFQTDWYEDFVINGEEDSNDDPKICGLRDTTEDDIKNRFEKGKVVEWIIDVDEGKILNWDGTRVEAYAKIIDEGYYSLLGEDMTVLSAGEPMSYVPSVLGVEEEGYGDYIIMNINPDGKIDNWSCNAGDLIDSSFGTEISDEDE